MWPDLPYFARHSQTFVLGGLWFLIIMAVAGIVMLLQRAVATTAAKKRLVFLFLFSLFLYHVLDPANAHPGTLAQVPKRD